MKYLLIIAIIAFVLYEFVRAVLTATGGDVEYDEDI